MSLPSAQRLSRTADFASVRESGRSWTGRHLIVAVRPRPDRGHAHFGFTTTRRIGNAVKRNLVRRRLRMIAQEFAPRIALTHDVVTIARHSSVRADYEAVRQDWIRLATRAGLFVESAAPMASPVPNSSKSGRMPPPTVPAHPEKNTPSAAAPPEQASPPSAEIPPAAVSPDSPPAPGTSENTVPSSGRPSPSA